MLKWTIVERNIILKWTDSAEGRLDPLSYTDNNCAMLIGDSSYPTLNQTNQSLTGNPNYG